MAKVRIMGGHKESKLKEHKADMKEERKKSHGKK